MCDVQGNLLLPSSCDQKIISIDEELWLMVEERAQEIICIVQPNIISEANRNKIIDFVRRLVGGCCGGEAFVFGSVPLKTYLPDGDIDFTIFSHESVEDDLPQAVCNLLESAHDLEYEVKDIQYIRAQVKVVKCTVKNIAVDISFNQMGGLYALRFLEQVDELVGKNHIFKRTIQIFGLLYSTFDWDKNYITIDGPQAVSSLPEIVEKPECDRGGLFLSKELVNLYRDMPRRSSHENNGHANGQNNNNNNNNNNASPKLSERKKIEEVLPETNIDDNNSKSFDLSNEYFPFLKSIGNTSSSTETEQDQNSTLLTKLSLRTKIQKGDSSVSSSQGIVPVVPETNMNDNNSKSFELSNEYFPILSIGNTSSPTYKKFEQDQNSAPLTKPSLGTKEQKRSSNVSSSQGAAPFVPSLAVEAKEKYTRIEEKMN
ncbi:PAP/OAS1 substrate-binding domain superfamily [Trifolium repens]|nr:PAP/OAS1 substrate-binding domain superfamily [Trifolium repens]